MTSRGTVDIFFRGHPDLHSWIFYRSTILDFKGHPEIQRYNLGLVKRPADI